MHTSCRFLVLATCLLAVMAGSANLLLPLALGKAPIFPQWESLITLTAFGSYLLLLALDWTVIRQRYAKSRRIFS